MARAHLRRGTNRSPIQKVFRGVHTVALGTRVSVSEAEGPARKSCQFGDNWWCWWCDIGPRSAESQFIPLHRSWDACCRILPHVEPIDGESIGSGARRDESGIWRRLCAEGGGAGIDPERNHIGQNRE